MLYILLFLVSLSTFADNATDFLEAHNNWRIKLNTGELENQPIPQPGIPLMEWDPELAEDAQDYADQCIFKHSNNRNGAGENLAMGHRSIDHAVDAWASEYKDYIYPNGFAGTTGHYTQVVWHNTTQLGCGYAPACGLYVCRYKKHGNFNNQPPYQIQPNIDTPIYKTEFTLENVLFDGTYHRLKMKNFVLTEFSPMEYDKSASTNYAYRLDDDDYKLYIPFVYEGNIKYYAILCYNVNSRTFHIIEVGIVK